MLPVSGLVSSQKRTSPSKMIEVPLGHLQTFHHILTKQPEATILAVN